MSSVGKLSGAQNKKLSKERLDRENKLKTKIPKIDTFFLKSVDKEDLDEKNINILDSTTDAYVISKTHSHSSAEGTTLFLCLCGIYLLVYY